MVPCSPINSLLSSFPSHSRPHFSLVRQKNVARELSQNRGMGHTVWNDWCHLQTSIWPQLQREKKLYVRGKWINMVMIRWPRTTKIKKNLQKNQNTKQTNNKKNQQNQNTKKQNQQNPQKIPPQKKKKTTPTKNQTRKPQNSQLFLWRRQMVLFTVEM